MCAAVLGLCLVAPAEARARSHRKSHHHRAAHHSARIHHRKSRVVIHQRSTGRVAVDRVAESGPFIPPTYYDYPPSPLCDPTDTLVEIHLHGGDEDEAAEAPETLIADRAPETPGPSPARARLTGIARKIGSFFRPKSSEASVKPQDVDLSDLLSNDFLIPVQGVDPGKLQDSFLASRGRHAKHLAIDIGAPRGTPILATTDGEIVRIARERRGGKTIYQKDASGRYLLFYCHLSAYASGLEVGETVRKGEVIGYVGSTGHVIGGPHLHFSITRVPDGGENFRKGLAINPYLLFLGAR